MTPPAPSRSTRLPGLLALAALLGAGAAWFLIPRLGGGTATTAVSVDGGEQADPERAAAAGRGGAQRTAPDSRTLAPSPDGAAGSLAPGAASTRSESDVDGLAAGTVETLRLHGRVLDPDGVPVRDAPIEAAFGSFAPVPAEPGTDAPRSGADGSFRVEVAVPPEDRGPLCVRASKACHRPAIEVQAWRRGHTPTPFHLTLVPVCVMTGRVLDDAGQPLPGAQVLVVPRQRRRTVEPQPTRTEPDGRFAFEVEEPGPCQVQIRAPGFLLHLEAGPEVLPGRVVDAGSFVLQRGYAIRGILLGVDGAPLAGRQVVAQPAATGSAALPARATSDHEGTFELLGLRRESYALTTPGPATASFRAGQPPAWVVAAPAEGVTLRVAEHLLVVGLGDQETGAPIEHGEVRVLRRVGQTVESDALGQKDSAFAISVDAGVEYGVVARARGYQASAELKVTLGATEPRRALVVTLQRERSRNELILAVTADSGEPVVHVRIEVFQQDPRGLTFLQHEDRQSADGVHRLGPLAPGRYHVRVHALRGPAEKLPYFRGTATVEVTANSSERRDLVLRRGALFVLHVRDSLGRYLGNVDVSVRGADGVERPMDFCVLTANTTSCDRNRVPQPGAAVPDDALPAGDYTLLVRSGSLPPRTVPVSLRSGQLTPVEVVLQ